MSSAHDAPVTRSRLAGVLHTAIPNQAVVSLGSLVVLVVAARGLAPGPFGLFASAQLAVLLLVGLANAAVLVPVMIDPTADPTRPVSEVRRIALLGGAAGLAVAAALDVLVPGDLGTVMLAVGITLPVALYWDGVRMHYQGRRAFVALLPGEVLAAVVMIVWVAVALAVHADLLVVLCGLAAGPAAAGLTVLPPWSRRWASWRRPWPRRVSTNMAGDYAISTGLDQVLTLLTAVFLSAAALGGLRLAQTALGPVNTLALALSVTVLPTMRDLDTTCAGRLRWATWRFGGIAGLALLIGVVLTLVPVGFGTAVLGESWAIGAPVVLAVAVYAAASVLGRAATRAMITSGASGPLLVTRAISAPVTTAVCVLVLLRGDLLLYVWTAAILLVASTAVLFVVAARAGARHG